MSRIILSTLNARYIHSSLGLRYLLANMGELKENTQICEFIINSRPIDIVESLLQENPKIIGFGVYIWNVEETTKVVALLKNIRPDIVIVLGGPEVSYEPHLQRIVSLSDYVISGSADLSFSELCRNILADQPPKNKLITSIPFKLNELKLPYVNYNDEDIRYRVIYVEASRGCPFKCEFCLSALDKTAKAFDINLFLDEIGKLYLRGARQFKFVDRTFNLKVATTSKILEYFLALNDENIFLHFELIPDFLPAELKEIIARFPAGTLQFEIGIQTFNEKTQALISRKQNNELAKENISWLRQNTHAHLHTDLIVGLPGDSSETLENSFNLLYALNPHEIQVGILKRLRGSPIIRHTTTFNMIYSPDPPYNILSNDQFDFAFMQRLTRFARFWDMMANSGRFKNTLPLILKDNAFQNFLTFSDELFRISKQTHAIALPRLFNLIHDILISSAENKNEFLEVLTKDFANSGIKGRPAFIKKQLQFNIAQHTNKQQHIPSRQKRHLK